MQNKDYYIDKYMELVERAVGDSNDNNLNYNETLTQYVENANAEEMAGYYLYHEKENAYDQWCFNYVEGFELSEREMQVTNILKEFL